MAGEKPDDGPFGAVLDEHARVLFARDMEAALERLRGGDVTAFAEAVRAVCRRHPDVPWKLVEVSEALVEAVMTDSDKRARREYRMHVARWEAVTELLERHHEVKDRLFRMPDDCGGIRLERDERGKDLDSAFDAVSAVLKGDEAGTARTIEDSYYLIEGAGGEGSTFESFLQERRRRK